MTRAHHGAAREHAAAMPSLPILLAAGAALAIYALAVWIQHRRGKRWSGWRAASFSAGAALLGAAFMPSIVDYAHRDLRGHMIQHLLIGMFAPLGLILGAPLTLAYRTLPRRAGCVVARVLRARPLRALGNPFAALLLNFGGMFALYATALFAASERYALLHWLVHAHFLLAGCLFVWAIAGPDPAPRRAGMRARLLALFLSMAAHAYLSKLMYASLWPAGAGRDPAEIQAAAKLMYYGGDLAELLLAVAFFAMWSRQERRSSGRAPLRYSRRSKASPAARAL